ncbi:molecular chaperone TorD family protein, partial [Aeromonas dhakensis]
DHLAIELDLMGNLIIRAAEATTAAQRESWLGEQESLLHGHLLGWFDKFESACRAADQFGFYGASARLLGVFLKMDANYLSLVKPAQAAD